MRPVTPRGFRDVLPGEAAEREIVGNAIADVFSAWAYDPVETPVVEVYETLQAAAGDLEGTAFRLFDSDGGLLALRPDLTVPIARLAATRMGALDAPVRLRYRAEAFREHESLRGQARQFTQLGVELLGMAGPAADAEVVAVLVETLAASGLTGFTVAIGDVSVLGELASRLGGSHAWRADLFEAVHARDFVAVDRLSAAEGIDPCGGGVLRRIVRTRGGRASIEAAASALAEIGADAVLGGLLATWDLLEAARVADRVTVDLGIMRSFEYYTGLVVEAYAPGVGLPIAGGGRYDGLLAAYGAPAPAAGFALGLERLMIALAEQGVAVRGAEEPVVVGGPAAEAFAEAARLRAAGRRVALASDATRGGAAS